MSTDMTRALLLDGDGTLRVAELELADPGAGDVRVAIEAAAWSGRDREALTTGARPLVLGAEAVGTVEAVGADVQHIEVGDRVVVTAVAPCRSCATCTSGEPALCRTAAKRRRAPVGRVDGIPVRGSQGVGALAGACVVPAVAVQRLPDGVPAGHAVLFSGALPTGVGAVRNVARAWPGERVVVLGGGAVGNAAVQGTLLAAAEAVLLVDPHALRRDLALLAGVAEACDPDDDVPGRVAAATSGVGADHVVVAAPGDAALAQALELVRPGGTITVVAGSGGLRIDATGLVEGGLRLLGARWGGGDPDVEVPRLLELAMDGRLLLDELLGEELSLDEAPEALPAGGGVPRRLVRP